MTTVSGICEVNDGTMNGVGKLNQDQLLNSTKLILVFRLQIKVTEKRLIDLCHKSVSRVRKDLVIGCVLMK